MTPKPARDPKASRYALTAAADRRAWDAVGHTEKNATPALFNFNERLYKVTESYSVK